MEISCNIRCVILDVLVLILIMCIQIIDVTYVKGII